MVYMINRVGGKYLYLLSHLANPILVQFLCGQNLFLSISKSQRRVLCLRLAGTQTLEKEVHDSVSQRVRNR